MAGNSFGKIFKLTSFGESHGFAIGGVIDGCPPNILLDLDKIQNELDRRKPGQSKIVTQRNEDDNVVFLSGIFEGKTTGAPIGYMIANKDQKSKDYEHIKDVYRPSHADFTYQQKYGIRDYRGGGRSSARETAVRVVAGAIAKQILEIEKIHVFSYVSQVGNIEINKKYNQINPELIDNFITRCPDEQTSTEIENLIQKIKKEGDTIGGKITCVIKNTPVGLGEPVFDRLNADLAKAMFSINAVKGFELGSGFSSVSMKGSEHNDVFDVVDKKVKTTTNFSGGIQGGISNGEDIYFNIAFKPVATIIIEQDSVDENLNKTKVKGKGRHDPCVVPRAVPIVDAMAAMVILDHFLLNKIYK